MIHLFSTSNFYLKKNPDQILSWALENEFDGIELFADVPNFYVDDFDEGILRRYARASGKLKYTVHSPIYGINIAAVNPGILRESLRQIIKVMEWSSIIDIEYFVIHPGVMPVDEEEVRGKILDIVHDSIDKILRHADNFNIKMVVENIGLNKLCLDYNINILKSFIEKENLGLCLDVGHGNISGQIPEILTSMSEKIESIHISDNYGKEDEHNPVGKGSVCWTEIVKLIERDEIPVVHEIHDRVRPGQSTVQSRKNLNMISKKVSRETL
ncbi:MAG: sugar phosphate isomerase/epimerase family protein [Elusimicrobiota bacterium]